MYLLFAVVNYYMEFTSSSLSPPFDPNIHLKCVPPVDTDYAACITELRSRVKEHVHYNQTYCTDQQLLLFLTARNFNVDETCSMMDEALHWRAIRKPHEYVLSEEWKDEISKETETGKLQLSGQDQWGRPVLIFDNSVQNTTCPDAHMRLLSWSLEIAVEMMPHHVDKYVIFMHMGKFSMWNSPSYKEIRETILMLCTCYPERLGHCVIYDAPAYFTVIYNTVKMFIDAKTLSKMHFISGDISEGSDNDKKLKSFFGDNWRELTGAGKPVLKPNCSPGYDHDTHWPEFVKKVDEARREKLVLLNNCVA